MTPDIPTQKMCGMVLGVSVKRWYFGALGRRRAEGEFVPELVETIILWGFESIGDLAFVVLGLWCGLVIIRDTGGGRHAAKNRQSKIDVSVHQQRKSK